MAFNKDVDCCSVIVQSTSLSCCFEVMDIGSKSFIVLLLYLHKACSINVDVCIAEFQSKDALDFIPALPCLGGPMDEHGVRPCDLASTRCMQLSVKISVVFSMSMSQSSSFEESCPSNVGISWSMIVVKFDSLCVAYKVSV